ncbi:lachesin-like isoform X1 [Aphis craccivora]|uniref:Lachesin-like isoform X1 n=1 Tax=Aphis craccivora TaxID=307492 RepID=A0A6G0Z057_APHCR|nr:lachesin-like isoform X1 [Aphis craccivora]
MFPSSPDCLATNNDIHEYRQASKNNCCPQSIFTRTIAAILVVSVSRNFENFYFHAHVCAPKHILRETISGYKAAYYIVIKMFDQSDVGTYNCISTNSIGNSEGTLRVYAEKNTLPLFNYFIMADKILSRANYDRMKSVYGLEKNKLTRRGLEITLRYFIKIAMVLSVAVQHHIILLQHGECMENGHIRSYKRPFPENPDGVNHFLTYETGTGPLSSVYPLKFQNTNT